MKRPARIHAGGYLSLFGPQRDGWQAAGVLLSSLRWHSQFRRARRIEDREKFQDMSQSFFLLDAQEGLIDRLRGSARATGATVNDVFLAAIAQVCDQYGPRNSGPADVNWRSAPSSICGPVPTGRWMMSLISCSVSAASAAGPNT